MGSAHFSLYHFSNPEGLLHYFPIGVTPDASFRFDVVALNEASFSSILAWLGFAWPGLAWHGMASLGLASLGLASLVFVWLGLAWLRLVSLGFAWLRFAWFGLAWLSFAWLCLAWLGLASVGYAWFGLAWLRLASLGLAWASRVSSFMLRQFRYFGDLKTDQYRVMKITVPVGLRLFKHICSMMKFFKRDF